jgi:hypothetical protein
MLSTFNKLLPALALAFACLASTGGLAGEIYYQGD